MCQLWLEMYVENISILLCKMCEIEFLGSAY